MPCPMDSPRRCPGCRMKAKADIDGGLCNWKDGWAALADGLCRPLPYHLGTAPSASKVAPDPKKVYPPQTLPQSQNALHPRALGSRFRRGRQHLNPGFDFGKLAIFVIPWRSSKFQALRALPDT